MPRRRRTPKRVPVEISEFDLALGPGFFDRSRGPDEAHVAAVGAWYAEHGAAWEATWIERHPGTRSWAWWHVVAGSEPPHDNETALRYIAEGGHLGQAEMASILAGAEDRNLNVVGRDGRRLYGDGSTPAVHGAHPKLVAARIVREVLEGDAT